MRKANKEIMVLSAIIENADELQRIGEETRAAANPGVFDAVLLYRGQTISRGIMSSRNIVIIVNSSGEGRMLVDHLYRGRPW